MTNKDKAEMIAAYNDAFRISPPERQIMMSDKIRALSHPSRRAILHEVGRFDEFPEADDPSGERSSGLFFFGDDVVCWEIDYYSDSTMRFSSDDPSDPEKTYRTLTVMLAEEF